MKNTAKHFLTTGCFVFLLCLTAIAQTNVSGFINANTTWNLAGSPYIVTGNALVSHGYTLTIEPGVVVKFNTDKALQIDGELIAIGTPKDRITFTSNQITPAAGDWAKIHFPDTCVDAVFDTAGNYISGSIMKYCDVLYGGGLGFGVIHNVNSSPYFSHCRIMNSESSGIYSDASGNLRPACTVDSSLIKNCSSYGLHFDSYSYGLLILNDTFENNNGGIFAQHTGNNYNFQKVTNNYFVSNYDNITLSLPQTPENLIVRENYFINNTAIVAILRTYNSSNPALFVDCNHFINNQTSHTGEIVRNEGGFNGSFSYNIFDGNTTASGNSIVDGVAGINLFFQNNVFRNNSFPSGFCLKTGLNPSFYFDHNEFINNSGNAALYLSGSSGSMRYNNFMNPNCQYELYNGNAYGSTNIHIDSSYWGGITTQHMDSVIYDYFDFANQSVVYYSPFLTSPVVINTTCLPFVLSTAINNFEEPPLKVVIYPNPATTHFTVAFSNVVIEKGVVEIYNLLGEKVLQQQISNSSKVDIALPKLPNGIYVVKVQDGERQWAQKLVVQ